MIDINFPNFFGKKLAPVVADCFLTVDFSKQPSLIMCSDESRATVVVVLKKRGPSGKYDNIVTMAHLHGDNVFEPALVNTALDAVIADFEKACGHPIDASISITVFGGRQADEAHGVEDGRGTVFSALNARKGQAKCTLHQSSVNQTRDESIMVFTHQGGTELIKITVINPHFHTISFSSLTKTNPAFSMLRMSNLFEEVRTNQVFTQFANLRWDRASALFQNAKPSPVANLAQQYQLKPA